MHYFRNTIVSLALISSAIPAFAQNTTIYDLSKDKQMPTLYMPSPDVPIGTIMHLQSYMQFDDGKWLPCSGQEIPKTSEYAALRAKVGDNVPKKDILSVKTAVLQKNDDGTERQDAIEELTFAYIRAIQ